jgi:hypothetical protein
MTIPFGGCTVLMLTEAYFDESGSFEEGPYIFCIAGYFIDSAQAKEMDHEWAAVLSAHHIPYFHMVDCAHGSGVFAGKKKEESRNRSKDDRGLSSGARCRASQSSPRKTCLKLTKNTPTPTRH